MPVTATHLTTGADGTDAASYTTASIAPGASRLVLATVVNLKAAGATLPTLSGASMTWTQVATNEVNSFLRTTVFRAFSASPGTGALTIDFSATNQLRCCWSVNEFSNVDGRGVNGASAIVQSGTAGGTAEATLSVPLAAFSGAGNATFGAIGLNDNVAITVGTGFSELGQAGTEFARVQTEWKTTNDTSVDWSWTGSLTNSGIAIELGVSTFGLLSMMDV